MTDHLVYIWEKDSLEVIVGLREDLSSYQASTKDMHTFSSEENLFVALQPLRQQGKIITIVSPLKELRYLWNE